MRYDGRTLSEFGDVVVVSVNHRLNILGTLDLSAYGSQHANSRYTRNGGPSWRRCSGCTRTSRASAAIRATS